MEQKRNSTLKTIMCSYEKLQSGKREFLGSTLFRTPCFLLLRAWVRALVRELGSHKLCDMVRKEKKKRKALITPFTDYSKS